MRIKWDTAVKACFTRCLELRSISRRVHCLLLEWVFLKSGREWDCLILSDDYLYSDHWPSEGLRGARGHRYFCVFMHLHKHLTRQLGDRAKREDAVPGRKGTRQSVGQSCPVSGPRGTRWSTGWAGRMATSAVQLIPSWGQPCIIPSTNSQQQLSTKSYILKGDQQKIMGFFFFLCSLQFYSVPD